MNTSRQLGEHLQRLRKARGMTQERLAELCDLTPEHVSGIERGRRYPSMKTLLRIAEVLRISLPETFRFQEPKPLTEKDRAIIAFNRLLAKRSVKEIRFLMDLTRRMHHP